MNLALIVCTTANNSYSALEFAKAAIKMQQTIVTIFFYQQGVTIANTFIDLPADEINLQQHWQTLNKEHATPLTVCSASALRRGIAMEQLAKHFVMGSLGQLTEILATADKVITFK